MSSNRTRRLFVLSLDGVPHSFVERGIASGDFPHLGELARSTPLRKIRSELPAVSSVAWTSFATGCDPATHGIFGFVDRVASTGELFIPTARHRRAPTIWQRLSDQGRPAISINVPGVYPPDDIRGCVVAGFLCPTLDRATTRPDIARRLAEMNYVIDVDATRARGEDKGSFIAALRDALAKRRDLALWLLEREPWDFFQLHIMETDRINHFLWDSHDDTNHPWHSAFRQFYREVDALAGEIIERVRSGAAWMILSDHGFVRSQAEINVNALLRDLGFLHYGQSDAMNLDAVEAGSKAFSILPGRIYVNLAGRERRGTVAAELYEQIVAEIAEALAQARLGGPVSQSVCAFIARTHDIYCGPLLGEACDLIAVGNDGFDLKAGFRAEAPFAPPSLAGIHTYDDAFVMDSDVLSGTEATIREVGRRVHELLL